MIETTNTDAHWNYFLSVEEDMQKLSRYVEFHKDNYKVFSIEIVRLLIASAAEVDVACKQICLRFDPQSSADNIHEYRDEIIKKYPAISKFEVVAPRYGLRLKPWVNWNKKNGVPQWWTAYNKIKHERHKQYQKANLKNGLNAVAGLFVMCLYLYYDKATKGELIPSPTILRPCEERFIGKTYGGYESGINYRLD